MSWLEGLGTAYILGHVGLLAYALRHQDDPFWYGFIHFMGTGRR